jgi:hypothetical protein
MVVQDAEAVNIEPLTAKKGLGSSTGFVKRSKAFT